MTRENLEALQQQAEMNPTSLGAKQAYINGLKYHLAEMDARCTELEQALAQREVQE